MSLITRCPACETLFKVVADQLRISDGWVRCGQCEEIFDASAHLLQAAPVVNEDEASRVRRSGDLIEPDSVPSETSARTGSMFQDTDLDLSEDNESPVTSVAAGFAEPEDALQFEAPTQPLAEAGVHEWVTAAAVDAASGAQPPEPAMTPTDSPEGSPPASVALDDSGPSTLSQAPDTQPVSPQVEQEVEAALMPPVSFLSNHHQVNTARQRPWVRVLLGVLAAVLMVALAGQVVFHERDRLAALKPNWAPGLQAACAYAGCDVAAWREIEAIAIDSTTFVKTRGEHYQLSFSIKNRGPIPLALPAIELTLTDALDRPLVRRVLSATQLGAQTGVLDAHAQWSSSLAMQIKTNDLPERIAGYRLLAFYP